MLRSAIVGAAVAIAANSPAYAQIDWAADVRQAREALEQQHPNFFAHLDREAFESATDALVRDVVDLSDEEVIVRLAELVAMGRDGHTRLTLPMAPQADLFSTHRSTDAPRTRLFGQFPVRLRWAQDGYVVVRAAPQFSHLLGARLVAIDGAPVARAEQMLLPVIHGDNLSQQRYLAASFMVIPEVLSSRGISRRSEHAVWRFELPSGRAISARLDRLDSQEDIAWRGLDPETPEPAQSITRTAEGVVIVRIAEVTEQTPGGFALFAEQLQRSLAEDPPRAVLIDLRGNIGGDNTLTDPLVRVLVRENSVWAPGRLFVATDGGTFSAAINLASDVLKWTPAIQIGAPSGGAPNHYGDAQRMVLRSSGLTLRVSSRYWQTSVPGDARDSMEPLVDAPYTVADVRRGSDPVLRFIGAALTDAAPAQGRWRGRIALGEHLLSMELVMGDAPTIAIPDAGLPQTTLSTRSLNGSAWEASGVAAGYPIAVRGRFSREGLLGQLEMRGRIYPFVLTAAQDQN